MPPAPEGPLTPAALNDLRGPLTVKGGGIQVNLNHPMKDRPALSAGGSGQQNDVATEWVCPARQALRARVGMLALAANLFAAASAMTAPSMGTGSANRPVLKSAPSLSAVSSSPLFHEYVALMGGADNVYETARRPRMDHRDALLVIDMQNDFVERSTANPLGGRFAVSEGECTLPLIVSLIDAAVDAGATVVATRDYHPHDHASFDSQGGPFPSHCIQGSSGAKFLPPIADALADAHRHLGPDRVHFAFKGLHEDVDSFGALPYADLACATDRLSRTNRASRPELGSMCGCTTAPWTGGLLLKQSGLRLTSGNPIDGEEDEIDVNAPPDVLAVLPDGVERELRSLVDALDGKRRIYVCGLALDFCVLDTCVNAAAACPELEEIVLVLDASRAAHVPGGGAFGSGFVSDPAGVLNQLRAAGVAIVTTASAVHDVPGIGRGVAAAAPGTVGMPPPPRNANGSRLALRLRGGASGDRAAARLSGDVEGCVDGRVEGAGEAAGEAADAAASIKSMKLYHQFGWVDTELAALGCASGPLRLADVAKFDGMHYLGTSAVSHAISRLGLSPGMRVLDVGSGLGGPARQMADEGGCDVVGIELQEDASSIAEGYTERCGLADCVRHVHGDFLTIDLGHLSNGTRGFDVLTSWLCFLHITDKPRLLARCAAALKVGGDLYIEDFFQRAPFSASELKSLRDDVFTSDLPSKESYLASLEVAGFGAPPGEESIGWLDMTAQWTKFVVERRAAWIASRERTLRVHGEELYEARLHFFSAMQALFEGGHLGGCRITAKLAD